MAFRIHIPDACALRDKLTVGYYAEDDTDPPQGECVDSGFTVGGVLNAKAGWSDHEIAEFREWLDQERVRDCTRSRNWMQRCARARCGIHRYGRTIEAPDLRSRTIMLRRSRMQMQ